MKKPALKLVVSYTIDADEGSVKGSLDGTQTFSNVHDAYSWLLRVNWLVHDLASVAKDTAIAIEQPVATMPHLEQGSAR